MRQRTARLSILIVAMTLSLAMSGCSANVFKDAVTVFDGAVGTTRDVVAKYETNTQKYGVVGDVEQTLRTTDNLLFEPGKCRVGTPAADCALSNLKTGARLGPGAPLTEPAALAKTLKTYSAGLVTIVNATTLDELDKSADKLKGDLSGFAKALGKDSTFTASFDPITTIFKFVVGNYHEYRRLQILKAAVAHADPLVQDAATRLAKLVGEQQKAIVGQQAAVIKNLADSYNLLNDRIGNRQPDRVEAAAKRSTMGVALSDTSDLQELLKADAGAAVAKMGAAHRALAEAVARPDAGQMLTMERLQAFASDVKTVYDAISKLR